MSNPQPVRQYTKEPVLVPRYVGRFQCLGDQCPSTCCSGWNVFVDPATHAAYKRCADPELAQTIQQHVVPAKPATPMHAATIQRDAASGDCPFLAQGWCKIQSTLGEEWLGDVCSNYPRLNVRLGEALFQSMSLSCPEAARLALTDPDAFEFEALPLPLRVSDVRVVPTPWSLSHAQMQDVHFFCIQLMRTQGLQLWERLVCLGLLCENLRDVLVSKQASGLNDVLAGIEELVAGGQVGPLCEAMTGSAQLQAEFFRSLWRLGGQGSPNQLASPLKALVDDAALIQSADDVVDANELCSRYQTGLYALSQVQGAHTLMEHAVLNDLLQDLFPFSGADPMHNYLKLVSRFGLLRWNLAQVAYALRGACTLPHLLESTQQYYKTFKHNPVFAQALHDSLNKPAWSALEKVIPVIKPEL